MVPYPFTPRRILIYALSAKHILFLLIMCGKLTIQRVTYWVIDWGGRSTRMSGFQLAVLELLTVSLSATTDKGEMNEWNLWTT